MSADPIDVLIDTGATVLELARMFGMSGRDVREKLADVDPICKRNQQDLYPVGLAAQYLVTPVTDLDEFISKMSEHDLPPALQKAFWDGMRSRQKYEEESGNLWPTTEVIAAVSKLYKTIKMSINVVRDTVERETELTPSQRVLISGMMDGALEDMRETIVETFAEKGDITGGVAADEGSQTVTEDGTL